MINGGLFKYISVLWTEAVKQGWQPVESFTARLLQRPMLLIAYWLLFIVYKLMQNTKEQKLLHKMLPICLMKLTCGLFKMPRQIYETRKNGSQSAQPHMPTLRGSSICHDEAKVTTNQLCAKNCSLTPFEGIYISAKYWTQLKPTDEFILMADFVGQNTFVSVNTFGALIFTITDKSCQRL